jgi:capsular polysaccharide transport system permease protein
MRLIGQDSLFRSVQIQARVVHALLMREIITRFGRHNIGFAWLFAEPMLFTFGIVILWGTIHGATHSKSDINIIAYSIVSYSTVLTWRNTIGRCALAIEPNASLLAHRNVRPIDFFISRIILELAGTTLSAVLMLSIFIVVGLIPLPANIPMMFWGWSLLCWYAAAMGLLIGGLTEFSDLVDRLWHPIAYFQLPVSGAFIMASLLPPKMREILLLFPLPNTVEIYRYGYFGDTIVAYYHTGYTCVVLLILTWLGLFVVNRASNSLDAR